MQNKQESVEWLIQQVKSKDWQDMFIWHKEEIFQKAREMRKQEIMDAHHCGRNFEYKYPASDKTYNESAEQYYRETFNK